MDIALCDLTHSAFNSTPGTSKGESSLSARLKAELSESYGMQVQQDCAFTLHSLADLARAFSLVGY